jgi:PIN domain nuclease of toxin-antitoxin system
MSNAVLDASVLLALLNEETGSDKVERYIPGAVINAVNLSEVIGKLAESGMPENDIHEVIAMLALQVIPFDAILSFKAGFLRPATRDMGLSLGDRACLATGMLMDLPVITSDTIWRDSGLPVTVILIR